MNQDEEALIVLALGILFCLIIIIASYSTGNSKIQMGDQRYAEGEVMGQDTLMLFNLEAGNKVNLLKV